MPALTCNKYQIIDLIEECSFKFTEGRCDSQTPIAIVLHEYDGPLEQLDNFMRENTPESERECHSSFHFGVGQQGFIHQYIDIDDTAWSFDPDWLASPNCGVGAWSIAAGMPNVDPNCYTINIAITTGVVVTQGGTEFCVRSDNAYSPDQQTALLNLLCCLSQQYGISVDQISIWRHLDELNDFPDYATFLESVSECVNDTSQDGKLDYICDLIDCLPLQNPTVAGSVDFSWVQSGDNESQAELSPSDILTTLETLNLPLALTTSGGFNSAVVQIDPANDTNVVTITFGEPQTNLAINVWDMGTTEVDTLDNFNVEPDSVTGDLQLVAGAVTSTVDGTGGNMVWNGPISTITFRFSNTNPVVALQQIFLRNIQSDQIYSAMAANAVAGMTQLIDAANCEIVTLPAIADGDFCTSLAAQAFAAATEATAGPAGTQLIGADCNLYTLPELCTLFNAVTPDATPGLAQTFQIGQQAGGASCLIEVAAPTCNDYSLTSLGVTKSSTDTQLGFVRSMPSYNINPTLNDPISVSGPYNFYLFDASAGNQVATLPTPVEGTCGHHTTLILKRIDNNGANTVTINDGGNLIDGAASIVLGTPGPFSAAAGEAVTLYWSGSTWWIA